VASNTSNSKALFNEGLSHITQHLAGMIAAAIASNQRDAQSQQFSQQAVAVTTQPPLDIRTDPMSEASPLTYFTQTPENRTTKDSWKNQTATSPATMETECNNSETTGSNQAPSVGALWDPSLQQPTIQDEVDVILGTGRNRNPTPTSAEVQRRFQHGPLHDGEDDTGSERGRAIREAAETFDAGIREIDGEIVLIDTADDPSMEARRVALLGPSYKEREAALEKMEASYQQEQDADVLDEMDATREKRQRPLLKPAIDDRPTEQIGWAYQIRRRELTKGTEAAIVSKGTPLRPSTQSPVQKKRAARSPISNDEDGDGSNALETQASLAQSFTTFNAQSLDTKFQEASEVAKAPPGPRKDE
jgi:hypothetical protein